MSIPHDELDDLLLQRAQAVRRRTEQGGPARTVVDIAQSSPGEVAAPSSVREACSVSPCPNIP